jgi:hypothetical protein
MTPYVCMLSENNNVRSYLRLGISNAKLFAIPKIVMCSIFFLQLLASNDQRCYCTNFCLYESHNITECVEGMED